VGRYAISDAIGAGGMATVHLARVAGPAEFSRVFAVKRLHPEIARDPELRAMFAAEARTMARIRHANVVSIVDVVSADGELLIVMEYIPGESLSRLQHSARAAGKRTLPSVASALVADVLRGLHAAHDAIDERGEPLGVVHRDVSPQNILVGADGTARVFDFGVAKSRFRQQASRGGWKGKPCYMAPEQLRGESVGPTADVWGAAVVLWETLTGCRLFQGNTDYDVSVKVLDKFIDPPGRIVDGISDALDAVVMRGLERNPDARFPTALDMAVALEQACPPASVDSVRAFLEALSGEALLERASRVREIEQGCPTLAHASADAPSETSRGRPAKVLMAAALLALASAFVMLFAAREDSPAAPGASGSPTKSTPHVVVTKPILDEPASLPSASSSAPEASVHDTPPLSTAPPRPTAPTATPPATLRPAEKAPLCDPPYVVDSDGIQRMKPECL
jgi:serine/threonine-protein kinase